MKLLAVVGDKGLRGNGKEGSSKSNGDRHPAGCLRSIEGIIHIYLDIFVFHVFRRFLYYFISLCSECRRRYIARWVWWPNKNIPCQLACCLVIKPTVPPRWCCCYRRFLWVMLVRWWICCSSSLVYRIVPRRFRNSLDVETRRRGKRGVHQRKGQVINIIIIIYCFREYENVGTTVSCRCYSFLIFLFFFSPQILTENNEHGVTGK